MITRRTDELRAGDRVVTDYGVRTVSDTGTDRGLIRVGWVLDSSRLGPYAAHALPDEEWSVEAPSKLDLAVRRAQELADKYEQPGQTYTEIADLRDLLAMFREAR